MTSLLFLILFLILFVFWLLPAKSTRSGAFEGPDLFQWRRLEGAARRLYAARGRGMAE
jgi:hypothetical protein